MLARSKARSEVKTDVVTKNPSSRVFRGQTFLKHPARDQTDISLYFSFFHMKVTVRIYITLSHHL
jgi:hypothetical protein